MTSLIANQEHDHYHLLMALPAKGSVLLEETENGLRLPSIAVQSYGRPASQITSAVFAHWSLHTVVVDWQVEPDKQPHFALLEILSSSLLAVPHGMRFVSFDNLPAEIVHPSFVATMLEISTGDFRVQSPFRRFGWVEEAKQWIRDIVHDEELEFTEIRQLNANSDFALVRFVANSGQALWLKATGGPNAQEFTITAYLAAHCPSYLPTILAFRSDWNAWIMEEFGRSLHSSRSLPDFQQAIIKFATLQKQLIGADDDLIAAHATDHRIAVLKCHINEIVEYLDRAMHEQTSRRVPTLPSHRLLNIRSILHATCDVFGGLNIPNSLIHGDISPGSILSDGNDCVFTDWCETYVGNPFITLEQLCMHVTTQTNDPTSWQQKLRGVYKSLWADTLTEFQLVKALALVPLLSVLSCLYGRGDWIHSNRGREPSFQGYTRSLARRMDAIVMRPDFLEHL